MFEVLKEILVDTGFLEILDTNDCRPDGGFCVNEFDNRVYIYLGKSCLAVRETPKLYYYTFCFYIYRFDLVMAIRYKKFRKEDREAQTMLFLRAIISGSFLNRQEEGQAKKVLKRFYHDFE